MTIPTTETIKDYFVNFNDHLTTFWTPVILALIFLSLAVHSLVKEKNIRMFFLYTFLLLCCIGYIAWGDQIISKLAGLW